MVIMSRIIRDIANDYKEKKMRNWGEQVMKSLEID